METPLVAGNATHLLVDGEQTFPAMFALIKSARQTLNLEYYIFEDIQSGGETLGDLLVAGITEIFSTPGAQSNSVSASRFLLYAGLTFIVGILFSIVAARYQYRDAEAARGK